MRPDTMAKASPFGHKKRSKQKDSEVEAGLVGREKLRVIDAAITDYEQRERKEQDAIDDARASNRY